MRGKKPDQATEHTKGFTCNGLFLSNKTKISARIFMWCYKNRKNSEITIAVSILCHKITKQDFAMEDNIILPFLF